MIMCEQKYCKHCIKPNFDLCGKFIYGYCKNSKYLKLEVYKEPKNYINYCCMPLYCSIFEPRKKKINY